VSPDGRAAGTPVAGEVLTLLRAGGPGGFTATMHQWFDLGGLASAVPASARRSGFGGLGYFMDAVSQSAGAARLTSRLRIAGLTRYQIDRSYQPKSGPLTIACDGEHVWRVFHNKITKAPAQPLPSDVRELADPSWLLRCWLAGGAPVLAGGRPAYRIDVVKRRDHLSISMMFPAAVAVVDAELGVMVRLTSYIGETPVQKGGSRGFCGRLPCRPAGRPARRRRRAVRRSQVSGALRPAPHARPRARAACSRRSHQGSQEPVRPPRRPPARSLAADLPRLQLASWDRRPATRCE
jgi:hypothetical protein